MAQVFAQAAQNPHCPLVLYMTSTPTVELLSNIALLANILTWTNVCLRQARIISIKLHYLQNKDNIAKGGEIIHHLTLLAALLSISAWFDWLIFLGAADSDFFCITYQW